MTRLAATLIIACAILTATTGAAQARKLETCALTHATTPVLNDSTSITSTGTARCDVRWHAIADLQVEQDGYWETGFGGGTPVPNQVDGPFTAGTRHQTPFVWGILDPSPYCAYPWRVVVTYTDRYGEQIGVTVSPTTRPTCIDQR